MFGEVAGALDIRVGAGGGGAVVGVERCFLGEGGDLEFLFTGLFRGGVRGGGLGVESGPEFGGEEFEDFGVLDSSRDLFGRGLSLP